MREMAVMETVSNNKEPRVFSFMRLVLAVNAGVNTWPGLYYTGTDLAIRAHI